MHCSTTKRVGPFTAPPTVDLHDYDVVIINTSAGKDSLLTMWRMALMAREQGFDRSRIIISHQDLGEVEWEGTGALAERQARYMGYTDFRISRARYGRGERQGEDKTFLGAVRDRHAKLQADGSDAPPWPSSVHRYCTSDFKRGPGRRVITAAVRETGLKHAKVLYVFGIRAEESAARSAREPLHLDLDASNGKRDVWNYYPIFDVLEEELWAEIKEANLWPLVHKAYKLGMPRLSCVFCIYAPREALLIAAHHNPDLWEKFCEVEAETGYDFQHGLSLTSLAADLMAGAVPDEVPAWSAQM